MKNIVFLNSLREVNEYLKAEETGAVPNRSESFFISIDLDARSYLIREGFSVDGTLAYFNNDSHKKSLLKSKEIAEWLRENSHFDDLGIGIEDSYRDWFVFWIRFITHYCLYAIEIISNAADKHKPDTLYASLSGGRNVSSLYIEPEEKSFSAIVQVIADKKGLKFKDIADKRGDRIPPFSKYPDILRSVLEYVKYKLWEKKFLLENMIRRRKPVFFTTVFYQMDKFIEQFKRQVPNRIICLLRGPVTICRQIPNFIIRIFWSRYSDRIITQRKIFRELEISIRRTEGIFSYMDISFAEIICGKIENNISNYIIGLMLWSIGMDRFIGASGAKAFISGGDRFDDTVIAGLCRERKIPIVLISHGSLVASENEYGRIEWSEQGKVLLNGPFSFLALQSPLSEKYLEKIPSEGKAIRTGPLIWGKEIDVEKSKLLFKGIVKGRYDFGKVKVIVHAGTPMSLSSLRLYVYETPDEYIQNICDLANAIEGMEDTILIVKFRPSKEISIENLKRLVPFSDKVILSVGEPFVDILGMADLVASFSSTTIEEALQNQVPVLLYGCEGRYEHIPAYGIKEGCDIEPSAVYHVVDAETLKYAIKGIFGAGAGDKKEDLFASYVYSSDKIERLEEFVKF